METLQLFIISSFNCKSVTAIDADIEDEELCNNNYPLLAANNCCKAL